MHSVFDTCLAVFLAGALCLLARERVRRLRVEAREGLALRTREKALCLLRLAVSDQRAIALTLFGHAEGAREDGAVLSGVAQRLLGLANDLAEQTEAPDAPRILSDEVFALLPAVEFAVAQVGANLGPSRRSWRIDPSLERAQLRADRRALNQVLVNVLTGAAAATRDGDWIEISTQVSLQGLALVIEDEGVGLPLTRPTGPAEESRGIGLRLTLARSLMRAHGGSLIVESAERVGTRVRLAFPAARLQPTPDTRVAA